ncbi:MAG: rhomboid family intramembrane serine protease [Aggregatilineales bacterium]
MSQPEQHTSHPLYDTPQQVNPAPSSKQQKRGVPIPMKASVPYVTRALIAINVLIFVLRYLAPEFAETLLIYGASIPEWIQIAGLQEGYRLFTSMFLHANEAHILFNMMALYYIGSYLELTFGHVAYLTIYILGGLTGSILSFLFYEGGIGASGAVFAIWGAEVVYLGIHRNLFGDFARQRLQNSVMLMGLNFVMGFVANSAGGAVRIGNMAHLGGLIGGLIVTWCIAPRLSVKQFQTVAGQFDIRIVRQELFALQMPLLVAYSAVLLVIFIGVFALRGA